MKFSSERSFQIWVYTTGHSQIVIRSNKDKIQDKRLNLLFKDVSYVSIPVYISDISVKLMKSDNFYENFGNVIDGMSDNIYEITHKKGTGYIVAGSFYVYEDTGEFFDKMPFDILPPPGLST